MAITGRTGLLAMLGALAVGLLAPNRLGVAFVTLVVMALALVDLALAGSVKALAVTRSGDHVVRLGEVCFVELQFTNTGSRLVRGRVRDAWPPSAGASQQRHPLRVAGGDRARLSTQLRPTRRGDRTASTVTVRSVGPLGLAARQRSRSVPWTVRALPPFGSRRHLPSRLAMLRELEGRSPTQLRGQGTEFDSLREYVIGDDVRSIDWRATARRNDVVVRTWRPERDRRVLIVLDTGRTCAGRVGDAPRLDASLDAALLLAALAARAGDRVDLLAYDRAARARVEGASASTLLPALVNAMATLEPALVETDLAGMATTILARGTRRSLVVLLTGLESPAVEQGLLPALGQLLHRHTVMVAAVADPALTSLAGGRGEVQDVYAAASAERALAERRRLSELLRRRGVEVVDAAPEQLPPAVADRYLALKAAGRL